MSFEAMAWAIKQECGSAPSKLVLLMLANHSNGHTGQCNPRMKLLAAECEMRPETLRNHVKTLEERGFITVLPQYTEGVQLPNQYRLNFQGGGGEIHRGGRGDFLGGGGGEIHRGGRGDFRPPYNQEVNQESKQERETPPITPQGDEQRKRSSTPVCPDFVDQQVWEDWLALRKAKKAPVTATVVHRAETEAHKAGMPLEDFLRVWCSRGSQGLEAAWLKPNERNQGAGNGFKTARQQLIEGAAAAIFDGATHV